MRQFTLTACLLLTVVYSKGQNSVAINNDASLPHSSAMLHVQSTTKGMLVPRMTEAQRSAIGSPATGLLVYQTNNTAGYWYYNGTIWVTLNTGLSGWSTTGNSGTNPAFNFIGTTDNQPLRFRVNGQVAGLIDQSTNGNTAFGLLSLSQNTTGINNIAIGVNALFTNTTGQANTAIGSFALYNNSTGTGNIAMGIQSLTSNSSGNANTAIGVLSLSRNVSGNNNVAFGGTSLNNNTTGNDNTAIGTQALFNNTTGTGNVAIGKSALFNNEEGDDLVAIGDSALFNLTGGLLGNENTGIGSKSLYSTTSGWLNTGIGYKALYSNTTGDNNTAVGAHSMENSVTTIYCTAIGSSSLYKNQTGDFNTALGFEALSQLVSGHQNTAIGHLAGLTALGSGNVFLGYQAGAAETGSNKLYIENSNANKDDALIFGDFAADSLLINGRLTTDGRLQVTGTNRIEMGYGVPGKGVNAGIIAYGLLTPNTLEIFGGGSSPTNRVIKFWTEASARFVGHIVPDIDNAYDFGGSTLRWKVLWAVNGTIQTSDARLKKNIHPLEYGLNEVLQLKPVSYLWKDEKTPGRKIGLIAQQVQEIIPELVVGKQSDGWLGMNYGELVPVLINSIQEQQQLISQQQKLIEKLEKRIGELEKKRSPRQ